MRELKYAILGLVNRRPITGYDITKEFRQNLSKFWDANHSQIYPELHRLHQEGLVDYTIQIQGTRLETKLYSITREGEHALLSWLKTDEPLVQTQKDPFRLKLYFAENLRQEETDRMFCDQLEKVQEKLNVLQIRYDELASQEAEMFTEPFSEQMLLLGAIYRERAYRDWLVEIMPPLGCGSAWAASPLNPRNTPDPAVSSQTEEKISENIV